VALTSAGLTVIAALGASVLTAGASLGVVALRERLRRKTADRDILIAGVTEMLSRSMAISFRAHAMGDAMKTRSGLGEGVDVLMHQRKPLDPLEIHDWIAQDMAPLTTAWSVIWARGDQELIRLANQLLDSCAGLMAASTARMPADTHGARFRRNVAGERWTPEMRAEVDQKMKELAHNREQLAQYARTMLGKVKAELFGHHSESSEVVAAPDQRDDSHQPTPRLGV
jgi:hypothetical protein